MYLHSFFSNFQLHGDFPPFFCAQVKWFCVPDTVIEDVKTEAQAPIYNNQSLRSWHFKSMVVICKLLFNKFMCICVCKLIFTSTAKSFLKTKKGPRLKLVNTPVIFKKKHRQQRGILTFSNGV